MSNDKIRYIDEVELQNKRILLRVDMNVSMNQNYTISDDARIRQSLPTIKHLLKHKNKLIIVSHLGRPKEREKKFSLQIVADKLNEYLPEYKVTLVDDFIAKETQVYKVNGGKKASKVDTLSIFANHDQKEIILLENIRFYKGEKADTDEFVEKLAALADVYVNDAFGVSHREDASVVGVPEKLPAYGGLLLKKEIQMIEKAIQKPKKPMVAIIGGAKIAGKIELIEKLMELADYLLIGGGLANTFVCAQGHQVGKSFCEYDEVQKARHILFQAARKHTAVMLPTDAVVEDPKKVDSGDAGEIKKVSEIPDNLAIYDIGPETQAAFGSIIAKAKTIIWNGPVGFFEKNPFRRGTDFVYYAITHNDEAISIVGGGDTLAAISKKEYLDKITHISTGGGAMLEFIEKGTLPGIEALKK